MMKDFEFRNRIASTDPHACWAVACLLLAGATVARDGNAQDKNGCLDAYAAAQRSQRAEHFIEARKSLLSCTKPTCPDFVQADCARWLNEVETSMPSVVLSARTAEGTDVANVKVSMDGRPLVHRLEGKAIDINPGMHVFVFEADGFPAVEKKVVIRTAHKNRAIEVRFASDSPPTVPTPTTPAADAAKSPTDPSISTAAYVSGAVSLLGWTGFTIFAIKQRAQISDLEQCSPSCPESEIDDARTTRSLAFVSFAIGAVASGITLHYLLDRPSSPAPSESTSVGVIPLLNGAAATVTGSF